MSEKQQGPEITILKKGNVLNAMWDRYQEHFVCTCGSEECNGVRRHIKQAFFISIQDFLKLTDAIRNSSDPDAKKLFGVMLDSIREECAVYNRARMEEIHDLKKSENEVCAPPPAPVSGEEGVVQE